MSRFPVPLKTNTVLLPWENGEDWKELALLAKNRRIDVRFIEKMPLGKDKETEGVSNILLLEEMQASFGKAEPDGRSHGNGPAVYYRFPGFQGSVGFISAMTHVFCARCNRVRLTSQGFLRPCLASESGTDLRALLRSGADDAALLQAIQNTILAKPREHHFGQGSMPATRGMYRIGG